LRYALVANKKSVYIALLNFLNTPRIVVLHGTHIARP